MNQSHYFTELIDAIEDNGVAASNLSTIGGYSVDRKEGDIGDGTLRITIASNDILGLNLLYSLNEHRFITTKFNSYTLGGKIVFGTLLNTQWSCLPNDSSCTWSDTTTEPLKYNSTYTYVAANTLDNGSDDGVSNLSISWYNDSNVLTQSSVPITSQSTDFSLSNSWEISRLFGTNNGGSYFNNVGDIYFKNSTTGKSWMYIPAGGGVGIPFSVIMPIGGKIYLDKLSCSSLNLNSSSGFNAKIELWISESSSGQIYQKYILFEVYILNKQQIDFDLSNIPILQTLSVYSNGISDYRYSVHLFVKGDETNIYCSDISGYCYLTCKVSR